MSAAIDIVAQMYQHRIRDGTAMQVRLDSYGVLQIEPTDRPEDYVKYDIDVETAVQVAFEHRPELAAVRQRIEASLAGISAAIAGTVAMFRAK